MATSHPSARDKLLSAAQLLFYDEGICATGIDAIVRQAGVAKKSLYNNFASKADLVNQYIEARHAEWLALYEVRVRDAVTPGDGILAVFDAYRDHAEFACAHGFRGCGLLNAAAELPTDSPGRQAVKWHKDQVESILVDHLTRLLPGNGARVRTLAKHLSFLLEGSITRAGLEGSSASIVAAKAMATDMIAAL